MTDVILTPMARLLLAERRAEALKRALLQSDRPPTVEDWMILQERSPPRRAGLGPQPDDDDGSAA